MPPDCPAWAGELFGELAQDGLSVYRVVEVLGLLDATRGNMTGQAIQGWGEDDGTAKWLSMVVQARRDAGGRFEAAHVVAEIEVVENILGDLRAELQRPGVVEDELGPEVEPEVAEPDRNGHAEDDGDSWLHPDHQDHAQVKPNGKGQYREKNCIPAIISLHYHRSPQPPVLYYCHCRFALS